MARREDGGTREDEELASVSIEIAGRLAARGISLEGHESAEELVRLEETVERFESAVEARGGDLMVDEGPPGQAAEPDDPHFELPLRGAQESVRDYLGRLARATDEVLRHPPRP